MYENKNLNKNIKILKRTKSYPLAGIHVCKCFLILESIVATFIADIFSITHIRIYENPCFQFLWDKGRKYQEPKGTYLYKEEKWQSALIS